MAHLKVVNNIFIEGKQENRSRLASILHFSLKWYALFASLLVLILIIAGFFYFSKYAQSSNVNWELPWVLVAIFTSLNLFYFAYNGDFARDAKGERDGKSAYATATHSNAKCVDRACFGS